MNKANPVVVGAFVVGAIGLMIFGVFMFGTIEFFAPRVPIVMHFAGSVKGLSVGAPIDFRGVPVGEVTDIVGNVTVSGVEGDELAIRIAVYGEVDPSSLKRDANLAVPAKRGEGLKVLIKEGLRAQLETQSILTGQKFVAFDLHPGEPNFIHADEAGFTEVPTIPSEFDVLKTNLQHILAKIERLPLETLITSATSTIDKFGKTAETANAFLTKVGGDATELTASASKAMADAQGAVDRVNAILEDIQRTQFIDNTNATVVDVGALARNANVKVDVLTEQVELAVASFEQASASFQSALNKAKETMAVAEGVIEPGSDIHRSLVVTLNDIAAAARDISETAVSIRILTDYLGQNPESVIFGKPAGEQ